MEGSEKAGGMMDAMGMRAVSNAPINTNTNNAASAPNVTSSGSARDTARVAESRQSAVSNAIIQQEDNRRAEAARENSRTPEIVLENVVSVSQDGDTVQVDPNTEQTVARENEGAVTMRAMDRAAQAEELRQQNADRIQAQMEASQRAKDASEPSIVQQQIEENRKRAEERRAIIAQNTQDSEPQQVTSFAGYTSSQIEQLYQQGRISRADYENQIAIRQDRTQSMISDNTASSEEIARLNGTLTRAQMDAGAIQTAFSGNANNNSPVDASSRMDAMQRIQDSRNQQQTAVNSEGRRQWDYQLQA